MTQKNKYSQLSFLLLLSVCLAFVGCYSEKQTDPVTAPSATPEQEKAGKMHAEVLAKDPYPSASQCAPCHEQVYDEWRSSNHAYSAISPMFHKFEQALSTLSSGTLGSFCVRCHMSVGTTLNEPRHMPLWKRSQVSREGVTCITCHRVKEEYGRVNGSRRIEPGDIHQPVYGAYEPKHLQELVANPGKYKINTVGKKPGPKIHLKAIKFDQLSKSQYCTSCHQVAVHPGIKLEVVWEQYRNSPAHKAGIQCQDCHMGKVPGVAGEFETSPVAILPSGQEIAPGSRHHNHAFYGPGYPTAHPGIFPHNKNAEQYSMKRWLKFNYRAGWGTEEFEEKVENGEIKENFPPEWEDVDDRYDAREIVADNLKELEKKKVLRLQVMENGSRVDGPFFVTQPQVGEKFKFYYRITNTDSGHNLPSGSLGAQPEIWMNVALVDPDGVNVWESGYVDSVGDMCDLHSSDVLTGKIPHDDQLWNLQTKFLTTNVKGTDREMYLPVNFDVDQRPFLRPGTTPNSVMNHPPFIRMEGRSLPPLSHRDASYYVPAELMKKKGTYRLSVRLRSRAEPIYFMKFVGATDEMIKAMNEWMLDIHPYTVEFEVK